MLNNSNATKQLRVALYLRVSTDEQTKGYGLSVQKDKLLAFIQSQDYKLDTKHIYTEEGFSGTLPVNDRPELKRLFTDAHNKEFDVVLVYRLDRFFRKTRLLLESIDLLGSYGVGFRSITEAFDTTNSTGKFMTTLLGAVAEMERDTIRERTMNGKASAAKAGKWTTGVPPYGYKINKVTKKLIIVEEEANVVRKLYEMLVYERLPLRELTRRINGMKIPSPKHTTIKTRNTLNYWHARTVGRILTNETYTGSAYFRKYLRPFKNLNSLIDDNLKRPKDDWIKIDVPAIVSRDIFDKAKEQLLLNRENAKRNTKLSYLYAKILYCGYCGFKLFSGFQPPRRGRNGIGTKYYHGINRKSTDVGTTKRCVTNCAQCAESRLEPIWDCLKSILKDPKNTIPALEKYTFQNENKESVRRKINEAESKLESIGLKRNKLVKVYLESELSEKDYKTKMNEYKNEEDRLKQEISKLNNFIVSRKDNTDRHRILQELHTKVKNRLDSASYEDKLFIINLFIERITLYTRSNYADITFRFPSENTENVSRLFVTVKIRSEKEIASINIKSRPLMYKS